MLRGPLVDEVQGLKSGPGKDIVATGSIMLVRDLCGAETGSDPQTALTDARSVRTFVVRRWVGGS